MQFRRRLSVLAAVAALMVSVAGLGPAVAVTEPDVGYRDFSYAGAVSRVTGEKPQSKLWYHDGSWWGVLFSVAADEFRIFRYSRSTHVWRDTGTVVDQRNRAKADVLWDGQSLYVVTATPDTLYASGSPKLSRFSYDAATRTYSRDAGFPVTLASGGMEAIVLAKDTTGTLWVTYTRNSTVFVAHSTVDDGTWTSPYVLPAPGTAVSSDDISSVVSFAGKIGVMWSNELDDAFYFAVHDDGAPDTAWQGSVALQGPKMVNDHVHLKADSQGRVYAAVKTSRPLLDAADYDAPYTMLLVRDTDGTWSSHVFGRVSDLHTRPILLLDEERRELYMIATVGRSTTASENGGKIYYKKTSMDNIAFPEGAGTPLIVSSLDPEVNDATSTKQNVHSKTGLLVLGSDRSTFTYLHNYLRL